MALSMLARVWRPDHILPLPLRDHAALEGHQIVRSQLAPPLHAEAVELDDAVVALVAGDALEHLLRHAHDQLRPGGWLYLSASGVSDTINAGYARLYAQDLPLTGERHSYLSRDEQGEILYMTHHFTTEELTSLLEEAGFVRIRVAVERETSSRRPDEAAYFLYATCCVGGGSGYT